MSKSDKIEEFEFISGYLQNTDGSVFFTQGQTSLVAGVYGPADVRDTRIDVIKAIVDINFRPKVGIPSIAEKSIEKNLRLICENCIEVKDHPKSCFYVIFQVMEDQGNLFSVAINALSAALQDAGVSMKFLPIAVSMATVQVDDDVTIVVEPSKDREVQSSMTFIFSNISNQLISCIQEGPIDESDFNRCLEVAKQRAKERTSRFRQIVSSRSHLQNF